MRTPVAALAVALLVSACVCLASGATSVVPKSTISTGVAGKFHTNEPLQLVRKVGTQLEVNPEAINVISKWSGRFDVVAVVGPFHSGKSFLLNQFLGRMSGFSLGSTVDPTTEGIWTWGTPATDGYGRQIIFLDTEGFAAPGNSPDYDAMIFAVSSLLSTHLIYNTVRIIDEQTMENLEILARRARLFQVKTTMTQPEKELLSFPPLTWVVEDFFQDQINNETPTQWFRRLLDKQSESGDKKGGLKDIFPKTYCKTLFLPATSPKALRNLDMLDAADLSEDFRNDMQALVNHVITSLREDNMRDTSAGTSVATPGSPPLKDMESQGRTAQEFLALLQLLVKAANSGSIEALPSMWELFLKSQAQDAAKQSLQLFRSRTSLLPVATPPLTVVAFKDRLHATRAEAVRIFKELLFNIQSSYATRAREDLDVELNNEAAKLISSNNQNIRQFVIAKRGEIEKSLGNAIVQMKIPKPSMEMKKLLADIKAKALDDLVLLGREYPSETKDERVLLDNKATNLIADKLHANRDYLQKQLIDAQGKALAEYKDILKREIEDKEPKYMPQRSESLNQVTANAQKTALSTFNTLTEVTANEPDHVQYLGSLKASLLAERERVIKANELLLVELVKAKTEEIMKEARGIRKKLALPMDDEELALEIARIKYHAMERYSFHLAGDWGASPQFLHGKSELERQMHNLVESLNSANTDAYKTYLEVPLKKAYGDIEPYASNFYFEFTFKKFALEAAERRLNENKERLSPAIKERILQRWLEDTRVGDAGLLLKTVSFNFTLMAALVTLLVVFVTTIVKRQ